VSVHFLRDAAQTGNSEKLIRFVRLHLGDGDEQVGEKEINKSWVEALTILLRDEPTDLGFIEEVLQRDPSTLALLFFHLHFYLIRSSGEWIHDGGR
jgi:hypothetical protein